MIKSSLLIMAALGAALAVSGQTDRLSEQAGKCTRPQPIPGGYAFDLENGYARITAYSPTTVRVRVTKNAPGPMGSFITSAPRMGK